jgi:hypothetical protein
MPQCLNRIHVKDKGGRESMFLTFVSRSYRVTVCQSDDEERLAPTLQRRRDGQDCGEATWVKQTLVVDVTGLKEVLHACKNLGCAGGHRVLEAGLLPLPKNEHEAERHRRSGPFATAPLVRGEIVSVKGGHLIDRATLERNKAVVNDADMQIADNLFLAPLTADEFEGVMMFLNHSCEPNVGVQGQIVFVALRDVVAGEELTLDYGTIDHDTEPMVCQCGAATCRTTITGEDWRRHDLQLTLGTSYGGYDLSSEPSTVRGSGFAGPAGRPGSRAQAGRPS